MEQLKKYIEELKNGTKKMFKGFFNKETNKKQRANMWTFSRLIIAFLIPIITIIGKLSGAFIMYEIAFATTFLGAATDFFDGKSARKHHSTSDFGRLLDTISDKVFATMIGISLSLSNPLFLINLLGEITIGIVNTIYKIKYNNINIKSTHIGKIKQWPLSLTFVLGFLSIIFPKLLVVTNILIVITSLLHIATIADYVNKNNQEAKKIKEHNQIENNITCKPNQPLTNNYELSKQNKKLDEYIKLRNILNEIINYKNNDIQIENNKTLIRKK